MKVNLNREVPLAAPRSTETKPSARSSNTDTPNFAATNKLAQQLATTPDTRADEVARAKALVSDPNYPDDKTIRAVARQMADTIRPIPDVNKIGQG